jgi:GPH family glycoside/pentoside/hexuronide:cation symporter
MKLSNEYVKDSRHSRWFFTSNATFQFTTTILQTTQAVFLLFYYEVIIGLDIWYVVLAMAVFMVYDVLNDPLFGYIMDKNTRLTRKWGRRFPWIVLGSVPWCISLWLMFSAPNVNAATNPWALFFWLLFTLALFDTFGTIVNINVAALRPDLFRTEDERRRLSVYFAPIDMVAQALGMLIPPLFIVVQNKAAYAFMGAMIAMIAIISVVLYLPGNREDKMVIERYYSNEKERMSFFKGIKEVFMLKSFIIFFIILTAFNIATSLLMGNALYVSTFVLNANADLVIVIFALFLLGALLSVPFWSLYLKKIKNVKKIITLGGFLVCATLLPMSFFVTIFDLLTMLFILGFCMGAMWAFFYPVIQAHVLDDYVVQTGKNQKGVVLGAAGILFRLIAFVDEGIIAIVHQVTGFVPGVETYEEMVTKAANIVLVQWGIRLILGLIPMLILLVGTLIFWKFYPLTPEKVLQNKKLLLELGF